MTEPTSPDLPPAGSGAPHGEAIGGVGARLRAARAARDLSINDVAQALKLGPRQVEALERGDWQGLPGQTFIRGFIRNYARLLHIDPAPLMDQLDDALEKPADSLSVPDVRPATMPAGSSLFARRDHRLMLVALAAVVLAALAYLLLPGDLSALRERAQGLIESFSRKDAAKDAAMTTPPVAAAPEPVFPPGATPQQVMNPQARASIEMAPAQLAAPAAAANQPLRFVVARESSIEVRDRDNKVVFAQRSPAGSEHAVGGQGPFSLVIGNAQGVTLYWRGQVVDLVPHTKGEVARLVLE